jgi:hypothetical protein
MRTANGFIVAASVAILLVHLDGYGIACCNETFSAYAFGASGIAADVVGAHTLLWYQYS